jgi:hypothetical protein
LFRWDGSARGLAEGGICAFAVVSRGVLEAGLGPGVFAWGEGAGLAQDPATPVNLVHNGSRRDRRMDVRDPAPDGEPTLIYTPDRPTPCTLRVPSAGTVANVGTAPGGVIWCRRSQTLVVAVINAGFPYVGPRSPVFEQCTPVVAGC